MANNTEDVELRKQLINTILIWSSETTGQPREILAPEALTLVDRIEALAQQEANRQKAELLKEIWNNRTMTGAGIYYHLRDEFFEREQLEQGDK